jgi:hypothetical protein
VDLYKALRTLYEEREKLDRVIASLEDLQRRSAEGVELPATGPTRRRGRKFMDEPARREVSERMKAYWERRKKEAEKRPA